MTENLVIAEVLDMNMEEFRKPERGCTKSKKPISGYQYSQAEISTYVTIQFPYSLRLM